MLERVLRVRVGAWRGVLILFGRETRGQCGLFSRNTVSDGEDHSGYDWAPFHRRAN